MVKWSSRSIVQYMNSQEPNAAKNYRKVSNIRRTKSQKFKWYSSRLAVVCAQSTEAKCLVDNEDVVGAAPTGDAPMTYELSTILLPTKVRLILETWR